MADNLERFRKHEIPGRISIVKGIGGLPKINATSSASTAEIYLHGAHITGFQKNGEPPLLFLSKRSYFEPDKAIRGGVPICFPWFGKREGAAQHGFARVTEWELIETSAATDGSVKVNLRLPESVFVKNNWPVAKVNFIVTVSDRLTMELITANPSQDRAFEFENCLHTYFHVADVQDISITGLKDAPYFDESAAGGGARKVEHDDALRIIAETDRFYPDTPGMTEIHDPKFHRTIRVEKSSSASTVVWNPWSTKIMADFDVEEHRHMVCVESGNAKQNKLSLPPGQSTNLKVVLGSRPL